MGGGHGGGGGGGVGLDIMGALQSRMKEMKIDKDRLDRSSSVSNDNKGRYLSQTSRESAGKPVIGAINKECHAEIWVFRPPPITRGYY